MFINIGYCLKDTQSVKPGVISVPELYRLILASAGTRGYSRPTYYAIN
jgi:hypothetical protein